MSRPSHYCKNAPRRPLARGWGSLRLDRGTRLKLDALGRHRGRTWRQMPGGNDTLKAITFWLWRRGLIANFRDELAAADAARDLAAEEAAQDA